MRGLWSGSGGWVAAAVLGLACSAGAQQGAPAKTQSAPATDSAVQASPATASSKSAAGQPTVDSAADASPVAEQGAGGRHGIAPHTALPVRLVHEIDSEKLKNGQSVPATLVAPVQMIGGRFAAGTPVELSVIATVPAGKLGAAGEFSLQLLRVGRMDVFTETQTFHGQPGHKDLPDSAAQIGTNAGLAAGTLLTFHVQPPPAAAIGPPKQGVATPGSVTGRASGTQGAAQVDGNAVAPATGQTKPSVTPANTTSTPVHGSTPTQPR